MRVRRLGPGMELEVLRAGFLFEDNPELSAVREYLADERNLFLVAYEGSEAVGFLRGTRLDQLHTRRKQMMLNEVGVDEKYRRRSIGRALLTALLKDCRELGFEEVFVYVDPTNVPAVRLFLATGGLPETETDRLFVYRLHSDIEFPV